jgi:hypothetical protein
MVLGIVAVYCIMCWNDKLKKDDVSKLCSKHVRMRSADEDPDSKPEGMRPLWRPMHKG